MYLLAYIELACIFILPGIAFIELSQVRKSASLAEKLGFAFGLGMSMDVLLMLIRESVYYYHPLPVLAEWGLAVSLVGIAASLTYRRRLSILTKPSRTDLAVIALVGVQALLVYAHHVVYPIFPQFQSVDFGSHVQILTSLKGTGFTPITTGLFYYGVYMPMLQLLALTGGTPFLMAQRTMDILVVLSPLLVFSAASAVSDSKRVSLAATFVYVAGGFIWFGSVFNAGLYPNFYGILATLLILVALAAVLSEPRSPFTWFALLLSLANALFSHYSVLTLLPAIVLMPLAGFVLSRKVDKRLVAVAAVLAVLFGAVIARSAGLFAVLQRFAAGGGTGSVTSDTPLSLLLSGYPFLRYIAVEITSDSATVTLLLLAALGGVLAVKSKKVMTLVPLIWFLTIAVTAPFNEGAWRFSYTALLPMVLLAAMGFGWLLERATPRNQVRRRKGARAPIFERRGTRLFAVGLVLLLTVAGSWGQLILVDLANQGPTAGQAQRDVYFSMQWLAANTPFDSRLVSITDSRYLYLGLVTGRLAAYSPLAAPDDLLKQLNGTKDLYVALTALATVSQVGQNPIPLYSQDSRFQLVYRNPDVLIFHVSSFSAAR